MSPKRPKRLEHSNTPKKRPRSQARKRSSAQSNTNRHSNGRRKLDTLTAPLRTDPRLLARIGDAITRGGYAGDVQPALLAYVAIMSRLLDRPMNVAYVSPTWAVKNAAVDAARALCSPDAVYLIRAASPKAVIHFDVDVRHKVVCFAEADSIPEDGPAGSAIRSLAADNEMAYDVVERDPETGKFATRRIVKPGPTGLLTTSTQSLRTQMNTRVLEVPLSDDPAQTRAVMRAHARRVSPDVARVGVDLTPYLGLDEWLARYGERRIAVPYAATLADLISPGAVRMRRDFKQMITAIQTIAFLYQGQRERTPEGWIRATFDDYEATRDLLVPVFEASVTEGLTPPIRETVEAIKPGEFISLTELAARLGVSKSDAHWRVGKARQWLVNEESRRGVPALLRRGEPLPDETTALPPVDQVRAVFESPQCSNRDSNTQPTRLSARNCAEGGTVRVFESKRLAPATERGVSLRPVDQQPARMGSRR